MGELRQHMMRAVAATDGKVGATRAGMTGHDVQLYRTDAYLTRGVVDFLAQGLRIGQPSIVIATEPHRRAFADGLRASGVDPEELFSDRFVVWIDARSALASFMEGARPNRELFLATIGDVFERLLRKRDYLVVRAYGEMVDLLAREGNVDGALQLEALWNELADRYHYSLLCGYSLDALFHEAGEHGFRHVLGHHTYALPLEGLDEDAA